MTLKNLGYMALIGLVFTLFLQREKESKEEMVVEEPVAATPEITLTKLTGSPAYADASLTLKSPAGDTMPGGETAFAFDVANYELGAQTDSPNAAMLANSGKGQHIHFIVNNQPYSAHYTPEFSKELPDGVHHLVAFLSRSYHESVKNENSVIYKKIMVGDNPVDSLGIDAAAPTPSLQ